MTSSEITLTQQLKLGAHLITHLLGHSQSEPRVLSSDQSQRCVFIARVHKMLFSHLRHQRRVRCR